MLGRAAGRCLGQLRADCGRGLVLAGPFQLGYDPSKKGLLISATTKLVSYMPDAGMRVGEIRGVSFDFGFR